MKANSKLYKAMSLLICLSLLLLLFSLSISLTAGSLFGAAHLTPMAANPEITAPVLNVHPALDCTPGNHSGVYALTDVCPCGEVKISERTFPDVAFRAYCSGFDADGDGILTPVERDAVSSMTLTSTPLSSLIGIEYFTALTELYCDATGLTSLDLSGNTALQVLSVQDNNISSLELKHNTALRSLACDSNPLEALSLSACSALESLSAADCKLASLELSGNTALRELNVSGNALTSLDLTANTALDAVALGTQRATLHISSDTSALNMSAICPDISRVAIISGGTLSDGILTPTATSIEYSYYTASPALSLSVILTLSSHEFSDVGKCECGALSVCEINFPDANLLSLIQRLDIASDGILTPEELASQREINADYTMRSNPIGSLSGLEHFTSLELLDIYITSALEVNLDTLADTLTSLSLTDYNGSYKSDSEYSGFFSPIISGDKSKLTSLSLCGFRFTGGLNLAEYSSLTELRAISCGITSLDLSAYTSFKKLNLSGNLLSTLDLSALTELCELNLSSNALRTLDLSGNTAISVLSLESNKLQNLDVSALASLSYLDISYNEIGELNVSNNAYLSTLYASSNKLSSLNLSANHLLAELSCSNNSIAEISLGDNPCLVFADFAYNRITELNLSSAIAIESVFCQYNRLSSLTLPASSNLTELYCFSNEIVNLDVGDAPGLEYLYCYDNRLVSLDITGAGAISYLFCYNNLLDALDTSNCTALITFYCYNNKITALDISNSSSSIRYLDCSGNRLKTLTMGICPALYSLYCNGNELTALSLSGFTLLEELDASANAISDISLNDCASLRELRISTNNIATLDLSNNTRLEYVSAGCNQLAGFTLPMYSALSPSVLNYLDVKENKLTALPLSTLGALNKLICYGNGISLLDISANSSLTHIEILSDPTVITGVGASALLSVVIAPDANYSYDLSAFGFTAESLGGIGSLSGGAIQNTVATFNNDSKNISFIYPTAEQYNTFSLHMHSYIGYKQLSYSQHIPLCECGEVSTDKSQITNCTYTLWTQNGDETHTKTCVCGRRSYTNSDTLPCSGGTATCNMPAICENCSGGYGELDKDNHTGTPSALRSNKNGTHNLVYTCCNAVHTAAIPCTSAQSFADCTIAESCACGYITKASRREHTFEDYLTDESTHSQICSVCALTAPAEAHSYNESYICTACNYEKTVFTVSIFGGVISGTNLSGISANKNSTISVTATVPEGQQFIGWYIGDAMVSADINYSFTLLGDVTLHAVVQAPLPAASGENEPLPTWAIVLIVIGGVIVATGAVLLAIFLIRKKKLHTPPPTSTSSADNTPPESNTSLAECEADNAVKSEDTPLADTADHTEAVSATDGTDGGESAPDAVSTVEKADADADDPNPEE